MASLGELFVKIGIDSAAFEKSITGLTNKVKAAGEQMQDSGQSASLYLTAPLALLGGAALKTAAQIEQTEIAFTSMLGSAEAAQQFVKELTQFAANTPFEMEGLSMASKTLLGFGVESENVLDTLKTLGDIAAGSGAPLEQLSMVFGQVKATGKAMTQDLYQFINAGVPIFKLLAEEMGVSEGAIKDLAAEGKITFDVVNGALQKATQEGGLFQNQMEKQSKSLSGLWSTFSDSVTLGLGKLGFAISEAVNLGELIPKMTKYVEMLVEKFNSLDAGTKKIIIIVGALVAAIGPLLLGLGFFMSTILPALTTGLGALGSVLSFLVSPVGLLVAAIVALAAAALYLWQNWEAVTDNMSNAFAKTVNYIIDKIKDLVGGFSSLLNKVGINALDGLTDKLEALKKPVSETTKEFKGFGESMKDAAKSVINNFIPAIDEIPEKVEELAPVLPDALADGFKKSGAMEKAATNAIEGLQSGLDKFEGTLSLRPSIDPEPSPKAKKGAKSMLQAMEKFIVLKTPLKFIVGNEQLKALTKKIGDSLKKVFDKVGDYAKKVVSGLKGLAAPITGGMESGGGALGALMDGNIIGALVSMFGDLAKNSAGFGMLLKSIGEVVGAVFTALAPLFEVLVSSMQPLIGIIGSLMSTLGEMLISVLEPILPPLMELLEIVVVLFEALKPLVAAVGELVGIILELVVSLLEPLMEPLAIIFDMITLIIKAIGPLIEIIGKILVPIFEIIGAILEDVVAPILALVASILELLAPLLDLVVMSLATLKPILVIVSFALKMIGAIIMVVVEIIQKMADAIQKFVDWIKSIFSSKNKDTAISTGTPETASLSGTSMGGSSPSVDYSSSSYGGSSGANRIEVFGTLTGRGSDLIAVINSTNKQKSFTT